MASPLARAFVEILPDFKNFGRRVRADIVAIGKTSGQTFEREFTKASQSRMRDARGRFVSATTAGREGRQAGDQFGQQFVRGADGRLRDSRGKFITEGLGLKQTEGQVTGFVSRIKAQLFSVRGAMVTAFGSAAVATLATFGIQTTAFLQQAEISFETLLGSAQRARDFLGELKQFAATTPFELPGLINTARQLVGAGAAASEVIPTLRAYGDAAGALGLSQDSFGRVMLAVTQIMNKGKVQAEELLQITEAGIPVYPLLSRALGMPVSKIQELGSQGKLLAKDVLPALQAQMSKEFGGAMAKQAQTLTGLWSTFMDTLNLGLANAIQPLVPTLGVVLPQATSALGAALKGTSVGLAAFIAGLKGQQSAVGGIVGGIQTVGNVIREMGSTAIAVGRQLFGFYQNHKTLVESTTAAVAAMFIAFKAWRAAVAGIAALRVAMLAFRTSMLTTFAAMAANPVGIIILALVGLGAALVVAYKRSETFRNIVNGAWAAVKSAVSATIDFLRPYWFSFIDGLRAVGNGAMWLWRNAIVPAFNAIRSVVNTVVTGIQAYFSFWMAAIRVVGSVVMWLYRNVVRPTFTAIGLAVQIFVRLVQVWFGLAQIYIKILASVITWLYRNVAQPVFTNIGAVIRGFYNFVVKPIFGLIIGQIRLQASVIQWLYRNVVRPIFSAIGSTISAVWAKVIRPTFSALGGFIQNNVAPAFARGVEAIRKAWDRVREAAKVPVRFIVNTVINSAIIDTYNKIAGVFGVGKVSRVSLPKGFASGGRLPGRPSATDNMVAPVATGEFIVNARQTSKHLGLLKAINAGQVTHGYDEGGLVNKIKSKAGGFLGGVADFISNPVSALNKAVSGVLRRVPGGGPFRDVMMALPKKIVGFMADKIGNVFSNVEVPGGTYKGSGGGTGAGLIAFGRWLQSMGYTVSEHPAFGGVARGAHAKGSRHYLGRAIDVNAGAGTSRTEQSKLAKIIGPAHAAGFRTIFMAPGHYNHAHIDYDQGGLLPPGVSSVYNGTRKSELVTPAGQGLEDSIYRAFVRAIADTGIGEVTLEVNGEEFKKVIRVESKKEVATAANAIRVGRR